MSKKNLNLAAVLAVLVAVAYLYQGPVGDWLEERRQPANFLADINTADVTRVEAAGENGTITLVRVDDGWKIEGTKDFYLKDRVVQTMETALSDAKQSELEVVSTNPDKKSEFETDEGSGTLVKLYESGNQTAEFTVGKLASDFTSSYVSQPGLDKTYKTAASLSQAFANTEWYDKTIFDSGTGKISQVRFQYPESEFTVEKEGEGDEATWVGTEPYRFRVDDEIVEEAVGVMTALSAADIPEQTFAGTGLEKHSIIVQATGEGLDNTLMVGDAQDPEAEEPLYYAKKGSSDNIYLITEEQKEILDKSIREMR